MRRNGKRDYDEKYSVLLYIISYHQFIKLAVVASEFPNLNYFNISYSFYLNFNFFMEKNIILTRSQPCLKRLMFVDP